MRIIDVDVVRELLEYELETGKLFWKPRAPKWFLGKRCPIHASNNWNARSSGKEAFTASNSNGYKRGAIFNQLLYAHRVCWMHHYGEWPSEQVDHINGNRSDNRLCNLRSVTNSENAKNKRKENRNRSGIVGVYWNREMRKWGSFIQVNGRMQYLGSFDKIEDAYRVRKGAEQLHGFHPNHGS